MGGDLWEHWNPRLGEWGHSMHHHGGGGVKIGINTPKCPSCRLLPSLSFPPFSAPFSLPSSPPLFLLFPPLFPLIFFLSPFPYPLFPYLLFPHPLFPFAFPTSSLFSRGGRRRSRSPDRRRR